MVQASAADAALTHWREAWLRSPDDPSLPATISRCLRRLGRHHEAERLLELQLRLNPEAEALHLAWIEGLIEAGQLQRALRQLLTLPHEADGLEPVLALLADRLLPPGHGARRLPADLLLQALAPALPVEIELQLDLNDHDSSVGAKATDAASLLALAQGQTSPHQPVPAGQLSAWRALAQQRGLALSVLLPLSHPLQWLQQARRQGAPGDAALDRWLRLHQEVDQHSHDLPRQVAAVPLTPGPWIEAAPPPGALLLQTLALHRRLLGHGPGPIAAGPVRVVCADPASSGLYQTLQQSVQQQPPWFGAEPDGGSRTERCTLVVPVGGRQLVRGGAPLLTPGQAQALAAGRLRLVLDASRHGGGRWLVQQLSSRLARLGVRPEPSQLLLLTSRRHLDGAGWFTVLSLVVSPSRPGVSLWSIALHLALLEAGLYDQAEGAAAAGLTVPPLKLPPLTAGARRALVALMKRQGFADPEGGLQRLALQTPWPETPGGKVALVTLDAGIAALTAGQAVVVCGPAGSLAQLRQLGFDVLDDGIDGTYDDLDGLGERCRAAVRVARAAVGQLPPMALQRAAEANAAWRRTDLPPIVEWLQWLDGGLSMAEGPGPLVQTLSQQASHAMQQGDGALAEGLLRQALELMPQHRGLYPALARCLRQQERMPEAEALLTRHLADDPQSAPGWIGLAELERQRGRWQAAIDHYGRALALDPGHGGLPRALRHTAGHLLAADDPRLDGSPAELLASLRPGLPQRLLIVLGMHRSGTSALAGLLASQGWRPPVGSPPPDPFNPRGYFEPLQLLAAHGALLEEAGSRWDDPRLQPLAPTPARLERLAEALQADFPAAADAAVPVVVKEPRQCRLQPLWNGLIAQRGLTAAVVLLNRQPLAVARSLQRRDGLPPGRALLLWLQHQLEAERHSRHLPRLRLDYQQLLADPAEVVRACQTLLPGVVAPVEGGGTIDRQLDHGGSTTPTAEEASDGELLQLALRVYGALNDPDEARCRAACDQAMAALNDHLRRLSLLNEQLGQRDTAQLFWRTAEDDFHEAASRRCSYGLERGNATVQLPLPVVAAPLTGLRLDPAEQPGLIAVQQLVCNGRDGDELWRWHADAGQPLPATPATPGTRLLPPEAGVGLLLAEDSDPGVLLDLPAAVLQALGQGGSVSLAVRLEPLGPALGRLLASL